MEKFNWIQYIKNYEDLRHFTNKEKAYKHWIKHGKKEGRTDKEIKKKSEEFDWIQYVNNYKDLKGFNKEKAYKHWINHGKKEGRTDKEIKLNNIKLNNKNQYRFIIVTTKLIESIAKNLKNFLKDLQFNIYITYELTINDCNNSTNNDIYIILNITNINHNLLPKKFIFYQLEQINSNWFTEKYYNYLNKSMYIWEFSIRNKIKYKNIDLKKVFYQMQPYYYNTKDNNKIIYDIFFYGAKNNRRENILTYLSNIFKIKIGYGIFDDDRDKLISQSKIILNLHYYNNCSLETTRLNEILQYDKIIISENPSDNDFYNKSLYNELIEFIDIINDDLSNINILVEKIKYYLNEDNYNNYINSTKKNKIILHNKSKFNIQKNIFNIINDINYKFNYDLNENNIYCLHLIETPYRIEEFKKQKNLPEYNIFPAFKYNPSWIGCALSYVNLLYNAKRCNLKSITICEDDCRFPDNFKEKYNIILEFLLTIDYDIFVGVIANLPEDSKIINIYDYKGIKFIELDKMHSNVFNIYNNTSYDRIINWNFTNDVNWQIDQYIKKNKFKIITTYPFYFDCINVDSTLWDKNCYNKYNIMFKKSLEILSKKILNFK